MRVRVRSCVAGPKGSSGRKRGLEDRAGSLPVRALPALLDTLPDGRGNAPGVTSATSSGDTCAPRRSTGARQAAQPAGRAMPDTNPLSQHGPTQQHAEGGAAFALTAVDCRLVPTPPRSESRRGSIRRSQCAGLGARGVDPLPVRHDRAAASTRAAICARVRARGARRTKMAIFVRHLCSDGHLCSRDMARTFTRTGQRPDPDSKKPFYL